MPPVNPNSRAWTTGRHWQTQGRARVYSVAGSGGGTLLTISDEATPFLAAVARQFPQYTDRALRHVGHWLQALTKQEMRAGAPGGQAWAGSPGWARYRVLDVYRGRTRGPRDAEGNLVLAGMNRRRMRRRGDRTQLGSLRTQATGGVGPKQRGRYTPLAGGLIRAVGYEHKPGEVQVGWLRSKSFSAVKLGRIFQEGKKTTVTPRMLRLFRAAGVLIGKRVGQQIEEPARPVFRPIFVARRTEIVSRLRDRIGLYLAEQASGRAAIRRSA